MKAWIHNKIRNNEAATISLALLEQGLPDEVPSLRYVQHWAVAWAPLPKVPEHIKQLLLERIT